MKYSIYILLFAIFVFLNGLIFGQEPPQKLYTPTENIKKNIFDSAVLSEDLIILVGEHGAIFRSSDGGKGWTRPASGTSEPLFSICFTDDKTGWISGNSGLILSTNDHGKTWTKQESGITSDLFCIHFIDENVGAAAGDWGKVVVTKDGGKTWQTANLAQDIVIYGVVCLSPQKVVLAGEFGMIFITENFGETWTEIPPLSDKSIFCLNVSDKKILYAGGMEGLILLSKDQGQTWTETGNPSRESIYDICLKNQYGFAVGDFGTVLFTDNEGLSWKKHELPSHLKLKWMGTVSIFPEKNETGIICGNRGTIVKITKK